VRFYAVIALIFATGLMLSGCESDPIPTAGSASQWGILPKSEKDSARVLSQNKASVQKQQEL
jgi:starvation-inducible outer membrane lipoprotein